VLNRAQKSWFFEFYHRLTKQCMNKIIDELLHDRLSKVSSSNWK
jgi:hypothetical protein